MSKDKIYTAPRLSGDASFKRNYLLLAAGIGVGLGYLVFLIFRLIPGYSTDFIYLAIPEMYRGLLTNLNNYDPNNPMAYLSIIFAFFVDFPSCLVWIIPGFLVGYLQNKRFVNIKIRNNGWRVFWHAMYLVEIIFIILAAAYSLVWLYSIIPGGVSVTDELAFLGSSIIQQMILFASPFLWLSLLMSGIGGYVGSKIVSRSRAKSELVVEEIEPEAVFEDEVLEAVVPIEKPVVAKIKKGKPGKVKKPKKAKAKMKPGLMTDVTRIATREMDAIDGEEILWPESKSKKMAIDDDDFGVKSIDISKLKQKIKDATAKESTTMPCPSCKRELPKGAKFCNFCGYKM